MPFARRLRNPARSRSRALIYREAPSDLRTARQRLTEVIAMYLRIGMPKRVDMADEMLGEL